MADQPPCPRPHLGRLDCNHLGELGGLGGSSHIVRLWSHWSIAIVCKSQSHRLLSQLHRNAPQQQRLPLPKANSRASIFTSLMGAPNAPQPSQIADFGNIEAQYVYMQQLRHRWKFYTTRSNFPRSSQQHLLEISTLPISLLSYLEIDSNGYRFFFDMSTSVQVPVTQLARDDPPSPVSTLLLRLDHS